MRQRNERALALVDDYIKTYQELSCASTTPHVTINGFIRDLQAIREELLPKTSHYEEDIQQRQDLLNRARQTCAYCGEDFTVAETVHILGGPTPTYYHAGTCFKAVLKQIDDNRQKEENHD